MRIIYKRNELPKHTKMSIFLSSPVFYGEGMHTWYKEALSMLEKLGYDGDVYVPLDKDNGHCDWNESDIAWERKCFDRADIIVMWLPHNMDKDTGLITNINIGLYARTGRLLIGALPTAKNTKYLKCVCQQEENIPIFDNLYDMLNYTVDELNKQYSVHKETRTNGAELIALKYYNMEEIHKYVLDIIKYGNKILEFIPKYTFSTKKRILFFCADLKVYIKAEDRVKIEFIRTRINTCNCLFYYRPHKGAIKILIAKEIRLTGYGDCYTYTIVGGSSPEVQNDIGRTIVTEIEEETDLAIDLQKLRYCGIRQACNIESLYSINMFSYELNKEEYKSICASIEDNKSHGVSKEGEVVWHKFFTMEELYNHPQVDLTTFGLISYCLNKIMPAPVKGFC